MAKNTYENLDPQALSLAMGGDGTKRAPIFGRPTVEDVFFDLVGAMYGDQARQDKEAAQTKQDLTDAKAKLDTVKTRLENIINDGASNSDATSVLSAQKVYKLIADVQNAYTGIDSELLANIQALRDLLASDEGILASVQAVANGAVRFDIAQNLTAAQKLQARTNIDALDAEDLRSALGDMGSRILAYSQAVYNASMAGTTAPDRDTFRGSAS